MCGHSDVEVLNFNWDTKEAIVKCKSCGRVFKLSGLSLKENTFIENTVTYTKTSNEDFDGGYVDLDGDIAP